MTPASRSSSAEKIAATSVVRPSRVGLLGEERELVEDVRAPRPGSSCSVSFVRSLGSRAGVSSGTTSFGAGSSLVRDRLALGFDGAPHAHRAARQLGQLLREVGRVRRRRRLHREEAREREQLRRRGVLVDLDLFDLVDREALGEFLHARERLRHHQAVHREKPLLVAEATDESFETVTTARSARLLVVDRLALVDQQPDQAREIAGQRE